MVVPSPLMALAVNPGAGGKATSLSNGQSVALGGEGGRGTEPDADGGDCSATTSSTTDDICSKAGDGGDPLQIPRQGAAVGTADGHAGTTTAAIEGSTGSTGTPAGPHGSGGIVTGKSSGLKTSRPKAKTNQ